MWIKVAIEISRQNFSLSEASDRLTADFATDHQNQFRSTAILDSAVDVDQQAKRPKVNLTTEKRERELLYVPLPELRMG